MNKNKEDRKNNLYLFILRRSIWLGYCKQSHVREAFGLSPTLASQVMTEAVDAYPQHLARTGKGVEARDRQGTLPLAATARRLLSLAASGHGELHDLGFEAHELIRAPDPHMAQLPEVGVMDSLFRAAIEETAIDILYVSLRPGESAMWRPVLPLHFECHEGQWRMEALDLLAKKEGLYIAKRFVLARLTNARPASKQYQKVKPTVYTMNENIRVRVKLNPRLTEDQKAAVARELCLDDKGERPINRSDLFEFRRKYADNTLGSAAAQNAAVVWPLAIAIEEVA